MRMKQRLWRPSSHQGIRGTSPGYGKGRKAPPQEGAHPADTLVSEFQPLELQEDRALLC